MNLFDTIQKHLMEARKNREEVRTKLLVTLYSDLLNKAKAKQLTTLEDTVVVDLIKIYLKNINVILSTNPEHEVALQEQDILQKYLPTKLTTDELTAIVKTYILLGKKENIADKALLGYVMRLMKEDYPNCYDSLDVKNIVTG